jgi:hypothetical protein
MEDTTESVEAANTDATEQSTSEADTSTDDRVINPVPTLMERLRAKLGDNPHESAIDEAMAGILGTSNVEEDSREGATEETATDATEEKPKADAKPEGEEKPKPDPEPEKPETEPEHHLQLKNARLQSTVTKVTAESLGHKKRAETAEGTLAELKERAKRNPLKFLEDFAEQPFAEIMAKGAKGEFDDEISKLPKAVQEELAAAKKFREKAEALERAETERRTKEAAQAKRQRDMDADRPKVQKFLEVSAEKLPIFSAFDDSGEELLAEFYDRLDKAKPGDPPPDLRKLAAEFEEQGAKTFAEYFTNKKLLTHFVSTNPQVRTLLHEVLGLTEQKNASPASGSQGATNKPRPEENAPPKTVATLTEIPARSDRELSDEELRQESIRLLRQGREAGRFQ